MKNSLLWSLFVLVLLGLVAAWYFRPQPQDPELAQTLTEKAGPAPETAREPVVRYPVPEPPKPVAAPEPEPEPPLPTLGESDPAAQDAMAGLFPGQELRDLFYLKHFIQRLVLMVDNLPRETLPTTRLPFRPTPGEFRVESHADGQVISDANFQRYRPYIRLAESVDIQNLVRVYVRFYPLFQEAYRDLGYPKGYFNDRLIEVLDHLLGTPDITTPLRVEKPVLYYEYVDPALESLSAGRKILLRIGPDNARIVKDRFRELRQALVTLPSQP